MLVLLLMGELWALLQTGSRFYLKARSQADLQRHALIALRWMSTDLSEGDTFSFKYYNPESVSTDREGIVFGSPKGLSEEIIYDSSGGLTWNSVVGYYIEPDSGDLYRTRVPLDSSQSNESAPQIKDEFYHIELMANAKHKRKVAEKAYDMEAQTGPQDVMVYLKFRDEDLGFGLTVQTRLEMKN